MATLSLNIPKIYSPLLNDESTAIEVADLPRTRLAEWTARVALASALQMADGIVVLITSSMTRERHTLETVIKDIYPKTPKTFSSGGFTCYSMSSDLWLVDSKVDLSQAPFTSANTVFVVDAELHGDILADLDRWSDRVIAFGKPSAEGEPWYEWARKNELVKVTLQDVISKFPDQESFALEVSDPDYRRKMLLHEDRSASQVLPIRVFARRRLFVRTDKTAAFLTPEQQAQAAAQHGTPVVTFQASALQRRYAAIKRLTRARGKAPWFLLLKYRRGGFTTFEQAENYSYAVQRPRSNVAALADTKEKMQRIFRIAKTYHEHDPRAPRLVGDSKTHLEFTNGSLYFIGTAGSSGFARGDTLQRAHGSEISKWCNGDQEKVEEVMAGLMGATEHGEIVLETTANGIEWFATQYRLAKQGANEYTPIFLRWFDDPTNRIILSDPAIILDTLTDKEVSMIKQFGLSPEQIAFRRDRQRKFGRLFPQEYPEDDDTCFIVSGTPFFNTERLLELMESIESPPMVDTASGVTMPHGAKSIPGGYEVRWEEPIEGVKYVLGADTSEGLPGRDPNGLGIMRKDTGKQVAAIHGYFNPRDLADHICRMSTDYNKALIGVERENHGHAVLLRISENGINSPHYRGGRLYFHSKGKSQTKLQRMGRSGWSTNAQTRPIMLDSLAEFIEEAEDAIMDRHFISEALTFRLQTNGKFSADPGCHVDWVMKWAICNQMRQYRTVKPKIII